MDFLVTFFEGLMSFISPCMLPLLPLYVTYFLGGEEADSKKVFARSLAFTLGFTVVFSALGAAAGALGDFLMPHKQIVNIVCGIIVIIFGISYMGVFSLPFFKGVQKNYKKDSFVSAFLFGMIFSINLSPCVGPLLGSALIQAANSGTAVRGVMLLITYSLGLGVPFILCAVLIKKLSSLFAFIKGHYKVINFIAGGILVVLGILISLGVMDRLSGRIVPTAGSSTQTESIESRAATMNSGGSLLLRPNAAKNFVAERLDGSPFELAELYGKPIVVNFWATWCPPCKGELPYFENMYNKYKDRVNFAMVNLTDGSRDTKEKVQEFIETYNYTFPVYYDTQFNGATTYNASSIPLTVFINKRGDVVTTIPGAMDEHTLESLILQILN